MIRVIQDGPVAEVWLARPEKRNALTPEMLASLCTAVAQVGAGNASAILLAGEGAAFCAGFDLSLCKDHPDGSVMRALLSGLADAIAALREQHRPVVIAAHGAAIAGGCALLGAGDFVVTNDEAKLGYPVVRLGVSPAVSAPGLRLRVGSGGGAAARELLLNPRLISGLRATELGLANQSVPLAQDVIGVARDAARSLAEKPAGAIAATRALLAQLDMLGDSPWRALRASLALTGGDEERRMLPAAWRTP